MADYRVVDIEQLESDLTTIANKIRSKSGGTSNLTFPEGFESELDNVSGGGVLDSILDKTIVEFRHHTTVIPERLFQACNRLTAVYCLKVTSIEAYVFNNCTVLSTIDIPLVEKIGNYAFAGCKALPSKLKFEHLTTIGMRTFNNCSSLQCLDLPVCNNIGNYAFAGCSALDTLILRNNAVCTLGVSTPLQNTPINSGTGYIYVPSTLVDSYKAATGWSSFANQFRAIEDYPEITGG